MPTFAQVLLRSSKTSRQSRPVSLLVPLLTAVLTDCGWLQRPLDHHQLIGFVELL